MPTVIGLLFFLASLYLFFGDNDELFGLVIFSAIFQSSSVIDLETAGVEPYYLVGSMFVLQAIVRGLAGRYVPLEYKGKTLMIVFCIIAITSAFTLPFVFAGIPVYEQHVGLDDGFFIRPPLQYRNANLTHSLSLLLGVLIVVAAATTLRSSAFAVKAYRFTFYFLVGIIAIQFICSILGVEFPYTILQNHAGRSMQVVETGDLSSRYSGTFTESSEAGHVLACFTAGFLAQRIKFGRSLFPGLIGLAAILLVRSSGTLAAIAIVLFFIVLWHPIFRFPFHVNLVQLKRVIILAVVGGAIVAAVIFSPLRDSLIEMTIRKQESGSFVNRIASDVYALHLFVETNGIGVGMGSNRPSSLLTSLLSTVGVLGLVVFLFMYFKLLSNAASKHSELQWAGLAYFLCLASSGPDYDTAWIWVFLAFTVLVSHQQRLYEKPFAKFSRSLPRIISSPSAAKI